MQEVSIEPVPLERLMAVLSPERAEALRIAAERARTSFGDRVIWHVNATAQGGGVAEMLQTLLAYGNGAGIVNRWLVLDADPQFFAITKRLHNMLHGDPGDGGGLGAEDRHKYEAVLADNLQDLVGHVSPGDIVLLHDPQTAGLCDGLRAAGLHVAWRCHVGRDHPNELTDAAWQFLHGYLDEADAFVFSRANYPPPWARDARLVVIPPSIDPYSTKNSGLSDEVARAVLATAGLVRGADPDGPVTFERRGGGTAGVRPHHLEGGLVLDGTAPPCDARLVLQVSRWDRLKDMAGVMAGFVRLAQGDLDGDAHLMLLGPATEGVSDDPEGAEVLAECREQWRRLPDRVRARVHLACVPMDDPDENAIIVNAVQRHAYAVVQKSLVEGFGLTVTEALWKGRPVLASQVGGIQDQIEHGRTGLLLDDPRDLDRFAGLLGTLLADHHLAKALGTRAHERALVEYVGDRHLIQYVGLFDRMVHS